MVDRSSLTDEVEEAKAAVADPRDLEALVDDLVLAAQSYGWTSDQGSQKAAESDLRALSEARSAVLNGIAKMSSDWDGDAHYWLAENSRLLTALQAKEESLAEAHAESAELTKALTGLTCGGSEFFVRKGERFVADIAECVAWVRRAREDAHRRTVTAIYDRNEAQARAEKAEASLVEAMGATREKDWPISTDGHHSISNIRRWMARQLMDSGLSDEEALGVVAYHPAITDISGAQRSELSTQLRDAPLPPSGVRDETDTLSRGSET